MITTHALFARKVQRKLSNGVAGFAAGRIIFGPTCARGRGMLAAGPELRITGAAAQTRMVSVARIRLVSRKSTRLFKDIICDDISEFESYMPSHAVGSLWRVKLARSELLFARAASGQCRGGSRMNLPRSRNRRDLSGPGCPRTRLFKGIICDDISEFESHMPATQSGLSEHLSNRRLRKRPV